MFKINSSVDVEDSIVELKKYFPKGFYVNAIILVPKKKRGRKSITVYYEMIKNNIIKNLINNREAQVPNDDNQGWVYCLEKSIHDEFTEIAIKYDGDIKIYDLSGRNKDSLEMIVEKRVRTPTFTGKVVFHT